MVMSVVPASPSFATGRWSASFFPHHASARRRRVAAGFIGGGGISARRARTKAARLPSQRDGARHPDGRKADDYIASLAELEKTAEAKKLGAWATSKPELRHPVVEETVEVVELTRWADRHVRGASTADNGILDGDQEGPPEARFR